MSPGHAAFALENGEGFLLLLAVLVAFSGREEAPGQEVRTFASSWRLLLRCRGLRRLQRAGPGRGHRVEVWVVLIAPVDHHGSPVRQMAAAQPERPRGAAALHLDVAALLYDVASEGVELQFALL